MRDFRQLKVWQRAHQLTLAVYRATTHFPREEVFGLTSQLRRGAASIGANIAEGCGRNSDAEFLHFLQTAMGSASEVENHLLVAKDLEYLSPDSYGDLQSAVTEVKKMLSSLLTRIRTGDRNERSPR